MKEFPKVELDGNGVFDADLITGWIDFLFTKLGGVEVTEGAGKDQNNTINKLSLVLTTLDIMTNHPIGLVIAKEKFQLAANTIAEVATNAMKAAQARRQ